MIQIRAATKPVLSVKHQLGNTSREHHYLRFWDFNAMQTRIEGGESGEYAGPLLSALTGSTMNKMHIKFDGR